MEKSGENRFKELTEVYKEIDSDQIELTRIGIRNDGSQYIRKYTWPLQGGMVKGTAENLEMVELLVAEGEWYAIWLTSGKQVRFVHKILSKDGKTMHQKVKDANPQGNLVNIEMHWERQ